MKKHPQTKYTWLQAARFAVQAITVSFTLAGMNSLVHIFGLPRSVFIATVIVAGMLFCGWGCPFGALQDWLRFFGKRLSKKNINIPNPWHRYLALTRYLLWLPAFLAIWSWGPLNARRTFLTLCAERGVLLVAVGIMALLLVLASFMDRPYCKYLCGFGSEFGLMGLARLFTFRRSLVHCVNCKKCDKACPMGLEVSRISHMRSANCINCFRCLEACPMQDALSFGPAFVRRRDIVEVTNIWLRPNPSRVTGGRRKTANILQQIPKQERSA